MTLVTNKDLSIIPGCRSLAIYSHMAGRSVNPYLNYWHPKDLETLLRPCITYVLIYLIFSSYGVYCEKKNNGERCHDYKYRLCCKKKDKTKNYGKWGKWGACMGSCKKDQGEQTRTRDCLKLKDGSYRSNCELIHVGPKKIEKWVVFDKTECTRTDPECTGNLLILF